MLRSRLIRVTLGCLVMAVLASCAADSTESDSPSGEGFPMTVVNCGTEVTIEQPPERVVTIKSTSTELLLALGAGDRIIAQAFQDGPVPDEWAATAENIETLSDQVPSQEVVLEQEPDFVFAGWESNLEADAAGDRETLARLGVANYVAPSACQTADQPEKMTYDLLFDHFTELGEILGVPEAAEELIAEQSAELEQVPQVEDDTTALWWSSGEDTPFVGGGIGAPQMVMDALGLENILGEVDETWTSIGWETIVDADPDVIVLVDADWNTAEAKIETLQSSSATAEMTAVREERFVSVPFPAAEAGVRSVGAATDLARQLADLGLIPQAD